MIPTIIIDPKIESRLNTIHQILKEKNLSKDHPNMLWLSDEEKLGIKEVKRVLEHLTLKPYQSLGQAVVILNADDLTLEAQNSLLKTLEESPSESIILLGVSSEDKLLPTVLSRCQIIHNTNQQDTFKSSNKFITEIEQLSQMNIEQRFQYIEKLKDKEEFFNALVMFFREVLHKTSNKEILSFLKEVSLMEEYWQANVNQRAILEYLMLVLPPIRV
jgi:DNA polymerase III delta prime subunit